MFVRAIQWVESCTSWALLLATTAATAAVAAAAAALRGAGRWAQVSVSNNTAGSGSEGGAVGSGYVCSFPREGRIRGKFVI